MSLRAWVPRWWAGEGGPAGAALDVALLPAEGLFRAASGARNRLYDSGTLRTERVPVPVISVGNLAVGGAGKTPFSAWLARRLAGWGRRPAVCLRGYGGDETLLHRELNPDVPVFAAARRVEAAREAVAAGCDAVVLDDAFQHRALGRDLDVVLVAAEGWAARRRLLPRGPWREDAGALRRAGAVVVTRKTATSAAAFGVAGEMRRTAPHAAVAVVALQPSALVRIEDRTEVDGGLASLAGRRVLAASALADPAPFLAHLAEAGAEVEAASYADHHAFTADEAAALAERAGERTIVTTHKDAVKLRPLLPSGAEALVLEQRVTVEAGADALDAALRRALAEGGR